MTHYSRSDVSRCLGLCDLLCVPSKDERRGRKANVLCRDVILWRFTGMSPRRPYRHDTSG